jgi:hypothetical protein
MLPDASHLRGLPHHRNGCYGLSPGPCQVAGRPSSVRVEAACSGPSSRWVVPAAVCGFGDGFPLLDEVPGFGVGEKRGRHTLSR